MSTSSSLTDVRVQLTMPAPLHQRLRRLADRDCVSLNGTVRRLIARALEAEQATRTTVSDAVDLTAVR